MTHIHRLPFNAVGRAETWTDSPDPSDFALVEVWTSPPIGAAYPAGDVPDQSPHLRQSHLLGSRRLRIRAS